ncbi:hypothetical protein B0A48_12807 [Cryoendolithus antarcticus]|uniref:DUF676 domain-containing protein n=1 Tax=Cryoendolithus antarcticus TaxID=1507870 RepID=A0A1V8SQE4_9PEZI|nr:hypothetical protein B0A48_12807 [Cryoendolithus antarcticus]
MLLVHQAGSVKIGEVVRYTLTYTPSNDRILPTPSHLHLKVKNTSALPLRAAFIHGPYTLHVAAYPSTFNPHHKVEEPKKYGVPEYEPMLKAAGSWQTKLTVPDEIRETGADLGKRRHSNQSDRDLDRLGNEDGTGAVTWIIEVASQILFSASASVDFEILVGRDERSLDLGFAAVAARGHGGPGHVRDLEKQKARTQTGRRSAHQTAGVYSKAVRLRVEDVNALWDKPAMPTWEGEDPASVKTGEKAGTSEEVANEKSSQKRKKLHLVVLTHGLHSNVGADMLFLKESIDATVAQARIDAKKRKETYRAQRRERRSRQDASQAAEGGTFTNEQGDEETTATAPTTGGQEEIDSDVEDSDDEETVVRGFSGNAARTENGIQYLGKRLAKYVLKMTYPDQPFLPIKKPLTRSLTDTFKSQAEKDKRDGKQVHHGSSVHVENGTEKKAEELPYQYTSISFIGHSLGGLVQTYAVAYIHKHSPTFFEKIKPVNFIAMASPMLGLSNENPMYVKFALDFGLVGRTGQDLGLTWKPPGLASARDGWNAMIGGLGGNSNHQNEGDPGAKPLLRILPTGPAHQVLRMFRNRTVYSNVVNDGIVPLRTSCLLFLDWRGLGKVDKARRENGLIGTAAEWAWNEITGANVNGQQPLDHVNPMAYGNDDSDNEYVREGDGDMVPQPDEDETAEDSKKLTNRLSFNKAEMKSGAIASDGEQTQQKGMMDHVWGWFRPASPAPSAEQQQQALSKKTKKALRRGQTMGPGDDELVDEALAGVEGTTPNPTIQHHKDAAPSQKRPVASKGDSYLNSNTGELQAPPKTSIFESAGDILHPPMPSRQWITDPGSRSRTIFHDRVYHPEDIPHPPIKRPGTKLSRTLSTDNMRKFSASSRESTHSTDTVDSSGMRVEEKIARAYHRDLSWRKVLVRLEPDAHNNIVVRRMFANAYGWPVVKHLCDTHFADTYSARTRDEAEPARERAPPLDEPIDSTRGEEVHDQTAPRGPKRTDSENREAQDEVTELSNSQHGSASSKYRLERAGSAVWDDSLFEGPDDDDSEIDERGLMQRILNPHPPRVPEQVYTPPGSVSAQGGQEPVVAYTDGHRGLAPVSPTAKKGSRVVSGQGTGGSKSEASVKPTFDAADVDKPVVAESLVSEPESLDGPGSIAEVGLRKSVEAQISPSKKKSAK